MRKPITKQKKVVATVAVLVVCALALDMRLIVRRYTCATKKLDTPVRIALVTDLHSCNYGAGQRTLLSALRAEAPDLVFLCGDIVDDKLPEGPALEFLAVAAADFPCYYVSGNHEVRSGEIEDIKDDLQMLGITVLEGGCAVVTVNGQQLNLCGVDDPDVGEAAFIRQLEGTRRGRAAGAYTLLLTHRPERIAQYLPYGFDLALAGHAHGGQWRIPGLLNGLIAPNQGLFPKYAGGLYTVGNMSLLVSRGLARESTRLPRIFNRPELVILNLKAST